MHELALADNIVQTVMAELEKNRWLSVSTIALRIGALSDVVPESLAFGFEALTRDTVLSRTALSIERIEARGICQTCDHSFTVAELFFVCPQCKSRDINLTHGMELDIAYLEVEESASDESTEVSHANR